VNSVHKFLLGSLLLIITSTLSGAVLRIRPYSQWTFAEPMQQVIYREQGRGFPIYLLRDSTAISLYDSTGDIIRQLPLTAEDRFSINTGRTAFMLVQQHATLSDSGGIVYSFQVYNSTGQQIYTAIHQAAGNDLAYQLTERGTVLLTEPGKSWVLELAAEDTLRYIAAVDSVAGQAYPLKVAAAVLQEPNELITANSCLQSADLDTSSLELKVWNHDQQLDAQHFVAGSLTGITPLANSDYYFLETERGAAPTLALFNRLNQLKTYPWRSWSIQSLNPKLVFVITDQDFNVINLGDGSVAASYHPIDISSISDACYLPEWGLFLYLRYEPYFTENGRQAFRHFELEGVDRSGRIVHRSSFGSWSYALPHIARVKQDIFGVHIYNSVLLYAIRLE